MSFCFVYQAYLFSNQRLMLLSTLLLPSLELKMFTSSLCQVMQTICLFIHVSHLQYHEGGTVQNN